LRGALTDGEEWQEVPEEWLAGVHEGQEGQEGKEKTLPKTKARLKTGLESDEESISDLTELSEDDGTNERDTQEKANADEHEEADVKDEEVELESAPAPDKTNSKTNAEDEDLPIPPEDFIEWETVRVL
jgi:hypothetical protein